MNDSLSNRLKRKRLRAILVALVALACLIFTGLSIHFEQADYTKSLQVEVDTALSILEQAQTNQGNANGQYAPYTILEYQTAVGQARMTAQSESSTYTQKQTAYQTLKEQTATFKDAQNTNSFSAQQLSQAAESGESLSFCSQWDGSTFPTLILTPSEASSFSDTNPVVVQSGPFTLLVSSTCEKYGLSGIPFTLLQDGDFCCDAVLQLEIPTEQTAGSLYFYNRQTNGLELVQTSLSSTESGIVSIPVTKGGDYFFAFSKSPSEGPDSSSDGTGDFTEQVPTSEAITTSPSSASSSEATVSSGAAQSTTASETTTSSSTSSATSTAPAPSSTPASQPSTLPVEPVPTERPAQELTVSLEIRCDPLANDPSKLTDPAKKDYVPADGTILPKTDYKMPVGSTVFDLLTQVCKNNNIHIEYSFYSAFQSYYIEGINHLYEFDGGQLSGWLYRVNGVFPGYGCSAYTLSDGDSVTLLYTCNGGEDVGNHWNG